jgi:hypothetical protein
MTKKTSQVNEGILENGDDDGWMAKSQLYQIAKYSIDLHKMISDTDSLEPWIQSKITKASEYMDSIKHYLEYEKFRVDKTSAVNSEVSSPVTESIEKKNIELVTRELLEFTNQLGKKDVLPMIEAIAGKTLKIDEYLAGGETRKQFLTSLKESLKNKGFTLKKIEERGPTPRSVCLSKKSDASLGASQLSSCKSQGLRARDTKKSVKIGKKRVKLQGKKIKGKAHGGPLPDWS